MCLEIHTQYTQQQQPQQNKVKKMIPVSIKNCIIFISMTLITFVCTCVLKGTTIEI